MTKYLTPADMHQGMVLQVRAVQTEEIEGWPTLVVYFHGEERGLILTKQLADQLLAVLGPNPYVEEFFASQKTRH